MRLTLIKPPSLEPVSLEETKLFLHQDFSEDDQLIQTLIKSARQAIENHTGRCLIEQAWCLLHSFLTPSSLPALSRNEEKQGYGIFLPKAPFIKLSRRPWLVRDQKEIPLKNYYLVEGLSQAMLRLSSPLQDHEWVGVEFVAGYGAESTDIPEPLRQAILMLVADVYENRFNTTIQALRNDTVQSLCAPFRLKALT